MSFPFRQITALGLFLSLTACPGRYYGMELSSVPLPAGGQDLLIKNVMTDLSRGKKPPGYSRKMPMRFDQRTISVESGKTIVWQIDRMPDGADCPWDKVPSQIHYGETPVCYVETVAAQPLVPGRAYSGPGGFFLIRDDGSIKSLSYRGYTSRTKKCAINAIANIIC